MQKTTGAYWYYFYELSLNDVEMLLVAGTGAAQGHRANQAELSPGVDSQNHTPMASGSCTVAKNIYPQSGNPFQKPPQVRGKKKSDCQDFISYHCLIFFS